MTLFNIRWLRDAHKCCWGHYSKFQEFFQKVQFKKKFVTDEILFEYFNFFFFSFEQIWLFLFVCLVLTYLYCYVVYILFIHLFGDHPTFHLLYGLLFVHILVNFLGLILSTCLFQFFHHVFIHLLTLSILYSSRILLLSFFVPRCLACYSS